MPPGSRNGTAARDSMTCTKCQARLVVNYDEPECLMCGYVNYHYTPANGHNGNKSIVSDGTHFVIRYAGESKLLANTLAHVKLQRSRTRAIYGVTCPFCGTGMAQSSLSGKRRELRETRFKCGEGHRVSIMPLKNGSMGWK